MVKRLLVLGVIVLMLGLGSSTEAKDLKVQLPPPPATLRVLSMGFNCPLSTDCSRPTINSIAAAIREFRPDILLVREVFWRDVGEYLIDAINSNLTGYRLNYFEKVRRGPDSPSPNGGAAMSIASTIFPIEMVSSRVFEACQGPDCLVNKGVLHLKGQIGNP